MAIRNAPGTAMRVRCDRTVPRRSRKVSTRPVARMLRRRAPQRRVEASKRPITLVLLASTDSVVSPRIAKPPRLTTTRLRSRSRNGLGRLLRGTAQAMLRAFCTARAEADGAVQRGDAPDHDRRGRPGQTVGRAELVADDRQLRQRRVEHLLLELGVAAEDEPEDLGAEQQQREDREEGVVGDDDGEVRRLVVEVLVDHGDRQTEHRPPALGAVDRSDPVGLLTPVVRHGTRVAERRCAVDPTYQVQRIHRGPAGFAA